jgi:hypothetical protein
MNILVSRGVSCDSGKWEYGFAIGSLEPTSVETKYRSWFIHSGVNIAPAMQVFPETVCRFTGIHDKNKKEIFENDYVKAFRGNTYLGDQNDIYQIVWSQRHCSFAYKCVKSDRESRVGRIAESNSHPYFLSSPRTEVIGNTYDNPELILQ